MKWKEVKDENSNEAIKQVVKKLKDMPEHDKKILCRMLKEISEEVHE
tara:strand:+ start:2400 stop:2540 length:141 start_codon:yes stop_codon:yes gene_type:complete